MSKIILTLVAITALLGTTAFLFHQSYQLPEMPEQHHAQFNEWKNKHQKVYLGASEESYRKKVWYDNYKSIIAHNAKNDQTYTKGVNQFMDLTSTEFARLYLSSKPKKTEIMYNAENYESYTYPSSFDWRSKGAVSPIKDQGSCGSCWAFSTVGALEGLHKIRTGSMQTFSEQQLVDCSGSYYNDGCNGGRTDWAFKYVRDHGITTESAYPYHHRDQYCQRNSGSFRISGYTEVSRSSSSLKQALTKQPISVSVDASNWQFYKNGIFSNCGNYQLNHAVLLVGYSNSYWTIKNSWNTWWGENGYIRLAMGNTCGLQNDANYPNL